MIDLIPPFRLATPDDAADLAELVNIAGYGLPVHVWTEMARDGRDPWEVGRARQADRAARGEVVVADSGGRAVAALTGYAIGQEPHPIDDDTPSHFRPMIELENLAPDSWYVNVLATYPEHQGKGYGGRLLDIAETIGRDVGKPRMSVIVAGDNDGARRLYERKGYVETARRNCVKGDWQGDTQEWVLLIKPL